MGCLILHVTVSLTQAPAFFLNYSHYILFSNHSASSRMNNQMYNNEFVDTDRCGMWYVHHEFSSGLMNVIFMIAFEESAST